MALTGRFLADFVDFDRAVKNATVELRGMETGAGKVGASLNKMVDSFSGRKLIQEATLVTEGIERIGGASKLTEHEQRKVNATVTEAIAKYRALGMEAPKDMIRLADATKLVDKETAKLPGRMTDVMGSLTKVAAAFGIAFSVGAVVNFGKKVFDAASQIHDMALQLGISAEAVQGFKFAAEQSGSSLDAVGTAITKMNQHLAEGDKSTVKALTTAGLRFSDIRNMKPEDAFLAIADAVKKIPDPMQQSHVALALFGKGAAELLPGMKEGFRELSDSADKMSNQTIKSLEAAQDAWGKLADKVVIATGTIIAKMMEAPKFTAEYAENVRMYGADVADSWARMADAAAKATKKDINLQVDTKAVLHKTKEELDAIEAAQKRAAAAAKAHADAVKALADAYSGAKAIKDANMALEAVNKNLKAGTTIAMMTRDQQNALNDTVKAAIKAYESAGQVAPAALRKIYDETFHLRQEMEKLTLIKINPLKQLGTNLQGGTVENQIPLRPRSSLFADMGLPTSIPGLDKWIIQTKEGAKATEDARKEAEKLRAEVLRGAGGLDGLSRSLAQLAQISGDTFGGMVSDLATVIGAIDTAQKGIASFKAGKEAGGFEGFIGMASGIMGIATAAIAAGKAIKNMFFGTAGRDIVKDFAGSEGGFDALRAKLGALGAEGEKLWIALTQGVGRNNPKQAQAAVDAIVKALGAFKTPQDEIAAAGFKTIAELQKTADTAKRVYEAMKDSGMFSAASIQEAWEQSQAAQRAAMGQTGEAYDKAVAAIKGMDDQIKSLSDSIAGEAPEEFMGAVEAQTRAQIAAIQTQRDEAQLALDETAGDAAAAAEDAADAIGAVLDAHDFRVKIHFDFDELPDNFGIRPRSDGGDSGIEGPGFARGTQGKYLDFGAGRRVTLHGRERIMTEEEGRQSSGDSGGGPQPIEIHTHTNLDGREVAEVVTRYIPDVVKRYGLA